MNVSQHVQLLRGSLDVVSDRPSTPIRSGLESTRHAAVLALLFSRNEHISLLLTERPFNLSRHAGQISLPGGAVEAHDADLWQTALRETREELGIRTGRIQPLGRLSTIYVVASDYLVSPFVAW